MRKAFIAFTWSVVAVVTSLVIINVLRDVGIRREIWHDVTSSNN